MTKSINRLDQNRAEENGLAVRDENTNITGPWSNGNAVAFALLAVGVVLPALSTVALAARWQPLAGTVGLAAVAAGVVVFIARSHRAAIRARQALAREARGLAERLERYAAQVALLGIETAAIAKTVDGERRNLGMVAAGLGELRQLMSAERENVGMIAGDIDETQSAVRTLDAALREARAESHDALARLDEIAARMRAMAQRQDDLQTEVDVERRNLGMVAGGLDEVRRLTTGVHLFDARQAAFEDILIQIADRIDQIAVHEPGPFDEEAVDSGSHPVLPGGDI